MAIYVYKQFEARSDFRIFRGLLLFCRTEIAQNAPRAAQNCSERAQSRSEPRRIAQSARSELLKAPLQIAQSAPRAAQSPSDSPRAVAQSRSESPRAARETDR